MLISVVRNGGKKTVGDLLSTISTQPVVACVILLKLKGKIKDIQFAVCKIELFSFNVVLNSTLRLNLPNFSGLVQPTAT